MGHNQLCLRLTTGFFHRDHSGGAGVTTYGGQDRGRLIMSKASLYLYSLSGLLFYVVSTWAIRQCFPYRSRKIQVSISVSLHQCAGQSGYWKLYVPPTSYSDVFILYLNYILSLYCFCFTCDFKTIFSKIFLNIFLFLLYSFMINFISTFWFQKA